MSAEYFLDTNVLVYCFDPASPAKRARARSLVETALADGSGVISAQVVQEFLNVALRRFETPMSTGDAQRYLRTVLQPLCAVFPSIALYERALGLCKRWRYGFYDSLVIAGALESDCEIRYSEDLQHGQRLESLEIVDPFVDAS